MKIIYVQIGDIKIGRGLPIVIQSMCNTPTADVEKSLSQCIELYKAGAQIVRLTTQGLKEVEALKTIKYKLKEQNINLPLVADVHFTPEVAFAAAEVADKVRINPGNFSKNYQEASELFSKLISICKSTGCSIRIGVNHGSLGERIISKFGDTPLGMVQSALEWIEMAEKENFDQLVISLKASNTLIMSEAYSLLNKEMIKRERIYPVHIGVTEAGNGLSGRIKSAVGTASVLKQGFGETIRVSLTESPVNEIPVAKRISTFFEKKSPDRNNLFFYENISIEDFYINSACEIGPKLLAREIDDFEIEYQGLDKIEDTQIVTLKEEILQASRRKFTKPEYIACPGCGRTLFDLESVFDEVKRRTSHLKGINIAVMGCIVNGPGEMADADYGYVGEGKNRVAIYKGKTPVYRAVPQEEAIDKLLELINQDLHSKGDRFLSE